MSARRPPPTPRPQATAARGFTLAELLVGILLSGIVVTALSSVFVTSSDAFHTQSRVSDTQAKLRTAIEQVKGDLGRAGLLATPNSAIDPRVCPKPDSPLRGIVHRDGAGEETVPFAARTNPHLAPDELVLTGNYSSAAGYPATVVGDTVTLRLPPWTGGEGRRPVVYTRTGFEAVFRKDQYVRIANTYDTFQIVAVDDVQVGDAGPEVRLAQAPVFAARGECGVTGSGDDVEVSPINVVEYRVEAYDLADPDSPHRVLVRQFLDVDLEPIDGTDIVVGDQIVDFQVWFMLRDGDAPDATVPEDPDPLDDEGNLPDYALDDSEDARPDLVRSAFVRLCASADQEDPRWLHRPRTSPADPLVSFDRDGLADTGAARVVCLTKEVELMNFANRRLRSSGW